MILLPIVINCPRTDTYEVILSEMMANTTLTDIVNEVKGAQDSIVPSDPELDYTRRVTVTDVKVAFIKKSNERSNKMYEDALIVVARNQTANAGPNQYSVTRYWQNILTNWVESEHLFDL